MATKEPVNLLDLAAAALSGVIVASEEIKGFGDANSSSEDDNKNVQLKQDGSFVTDADFAAQSIIVQSLQNISKEVRLVGEEDMEFEKIITGQEEKSLQMFRLAQKEILLRHRHSNEPLPLAQSSNINEKKKESTANLPETQQGNETEAAEESSRLNEFQVDPSRVSVFIDPLDGTKAYTTGDYETVSILVAIILDEAPCFGVICKPFGYMGFTSVLDSGCVAFYGGTLLGAAYTAGGSVCKFNTEISNGELPRAVISSSRAKGVVQEFVTHLGSKGMIHPEPLMISGAGEKSLRIIVRSKNEGLWFFPKAGTSLWDVAASDALLRAMGGRLTDKNGKDMDYSKSRKDAQNQDGVVACYDHRLHAECIRLFLEGTWTE